MATSDVTTTPVHELPSSRSLVPLPIAMVGGSLFVVADLIEDLTTDNDLNRALLRTIVLVLLTGCAGIERLGSRQHRFTWQLVARFVWLGIFSASLSLLPPLSDDSITNAAAYTAFTLIGTSLIWNSTSYGMIMTLPILAPFALRVGLNRDLSTAALKFIVIGLIVAFSITAMNAHTRKRITVLSRELEYQASHDPLTGLLNRSAWTSRAHALLASQDAQGLTASVLYIDADQLKRVNDQFGHHQGDLLLQRIATCLSATAPADALVGRIGGDEFVMLLPGYSLGMANGMCRTVQLALTNAIDGAISATIGVEEHQTGGSLSTLVNRADMTMLSTKAPREDRRETIAHSPGFTDSPVTIPAGESEYPRVPTTNLSPMPAPGK